MRSYYTLLATLVLLGTCAAYAGARWYAQQAAPWVLRLPDAGEQVMSRAQSLERAGLVLQAEAAYREALGKDFAGRQNVTFCLARLGSLLWNRGAKEEALLLLERAVAGQEGNVQLEAFEPLAQALLERGQLDRVENLVGQWRALAVEPREQADALCAAGQLALTQGRREEGMALLEESRALEVNGRGAFYLAQVRKGEERQQLLLEALVEGLSGLEAAQARAGLE